MDARKKAATLLGNFESEQALEVLMRSAVSDDVREREAAMMGLIEMGVKAKAAFSIVLSKTEDEEPKVRESATTALARIAPEAPETVPTLIRSLEDPDESTRLNAVIAPGVVGPNASPAIPKLLNFVKNGEGSLPRISAYALMNIAPETPELITFWISKLWEDDNILSHDSIDQLVRIQKGAEIVVPLLISEAENSNNIQRFNAVRILGDYGALGKSAIPTLEKLLQDAHPEMRDIAKKSLQKI